GLRAHRRPRLRLGVPGTDRRGAVAAADRGGGQRLPAVRVVAVRRVLRRLPGEDRHPLAPGASAGPPRRGIRPGAPGRQPGGGHHGRRLLGDGQPGAVGGGAGRQPAWPRARPPRPHPPAPAAAVGLDRRAGRTGAAAPDLPRVVAEGTRGPAVTGPAARDEVLARIRTALGQPASASSASASSASASSSSGGSASASPASGGSAPGGQAPPADPVPRGYRTSGDLAAARLLDLLAERLRDYGCTVRRVAPGQVMTAAGEALGQRGALRIVVPSG